MTRPPTVVLVLLSCVISMSQWPRFAVVTGSWVGHPESPYEARMALLEHVLLNDARWSPVLKQKVKLSVLNLPCYRLMKSNLDVLDKIQLVAKNEDQDPTILKVIQNLMDKTPWSGTNVNFATRALSTAVTCFTYNNLSFVLSLVVNHIGMLAQKLKILDKKNDDDKDKINKALDNVRMTLAVLVTKVASMEGDVNFLATGLYGYDGAEKSVEEFVLLRVLEIMKNDLDVKLEQHCHLTPHTEIYKYLAKHGSLNTSPLPPDQLAYDDATLKNELAEFDKIIDCMIEVYDQLDVETMPMETWLQIIDYKVPFTMKINFFTHGALKVLIHPKIEDEFADRLKGVTKIEKKEGGTPMEKEIEHK